MSVVDHLKPRQFIVVTPREEEESYMDMLTLGPRKRRHFNGIPCQVVAVQLPLIVVDMGGKREVLDSRNYEFQVISKYFFEAIDTRKPIANTRKRKKDKPPVGACQRCGSKLSMRMLKAKDGWHPYCASCGWQGDPVRSEP